MKYFIQLIIK